MIYDQAERGEAGHPRYLAFLLDLFRGSSSPYINRFLSADTIVPGYTNPQNLNRYSYVTNNPLRYIDPTGHKPACGEYGEECSEDELVAITGGAPGSGVSQENEKDEDTGGGGHPLLTPSPIVTLENSYCGGGLNGFYNFFDCTANITQDLALLIDTPFAFGELVLITAGCFAGPKGCLAGAGVAATIFNITGANAAETGLSSAATVLSIAADFADDGDFGESTAVSFTAGVAGFFSPDPIIDFAIDGFGSAYNHDVKPISGIPALIGSLFGH